MSDKIYICDKWGCKDDVLEVSNRNALKPGEKWNERSLLKGVKELQDALKGDKIFDEGATFADGSITDEDRDGFLELHPEKVRLWDYEEGDFYAANNSVFSQLVAEGTGKGKWRFAEYFFTAGERKAAPWAFPFPRHDYQAAKVHFQKKYGGLAANAPNLRAKTMELAAELQNYLGQMAVHYNQPTDQGIFAGDQWLKSPFARLPDEREIWNCVVYSQVSKFILEGLKFDDGRTSYFTCHDAKIEPANSKAPGHRMMGAVSTIGGMGLVVDNHYVSLITNNPDEAQGRFSTAGSLTEFLTRVAGNMSSLFENGNRILLDGKPLTEADTQCHWRPEGVVNVVETFTRLVFVAGIQSFTTPSWMQASEVAQLVFDYVKNNPNGMDRLMKAAGENPETKWSFISLLASVPNEAYRDLANKFAEAFTDHGDSARMEQMMKMIDPPLFFGSYLEGKFEEIMGGENEWKKAHHLAFDFFALLSEEQAAPFLKKLEENPHLLAKVGVELVAGRHLVRGLNMLGAANRQKPEDLEIACHYTEAIFALGTRDEPLKVEHELQKVYLPLRAIHAESKLDKFYLGVLASRAGDSERAVELLRRLDPRDYVMERRQIDALPDLVRSDVSSFEYDLSLLRSLEALIIGVKQEIYGMRDEQQSLWEQIALIPTMPKHERQAAKVRLTGEQKEAAGRLKTFKENLAKLEKEAEPAFERIQQALAAMEACLADDGSQMCIEPYPMNTSRHLYYSMGRIMEQDPSGRASTWYIGASGYDPLLQRMESPDSKGPVRF
ncbi:MAG: hypothetical protein Q7T11_08950 [Deltaproteobacteria bacterium]|nr:hypothetical protein [Deltaproteobacteria bacterium]